MRQVNLLAEQEATAMVRMLERITVHLGLPVDGDTDTLATRTDLEQLVTELGREAAQPIDGRRSASGPRAFVLSDGGGPARKGEKEVP